MFRYRAVGYALVMLAASCGGERGEAPAPTWRADYRPFAANSPLRQPLPADVEIHPRSREMIADLYEACTEARTGPCKFPRLAGAPESGRFFTEFGTPVYLANAGTPRRTVTCVRFACGIEGDRGEDTSALRRVPIPSGARAESSVDGHMVVYDPERGYAWEFYRATHSATGDRWRAEGGIRWNLKGLGVDAIGEPGGAVGGGVSMMGTVLRPEEVRLALADGTGVVPHVLSGGYDSPRVNCFIGPIAKSTDGDDGRRWAIPEGAILQLDPALDLAELGLDPAAAVIARTLQRHGMVVRDDNGAFSIDVENVSAEDRAEPARAKLWHELGIDKNSLRALQGNLFRVVAWHRSQAHGTNCL